MAPTRKGGAPIVETVRLKVCERELSSREGRMNLPKSSCEAAA
jgi:hypothetical protein